MNTKLRSQIISTDGVTLIALVVTIIILIILAGITIASLTGDNSIIKEARTAKELTEKAALEEQVELAIIQAEKKHKNPSLDDVIEEIKNNKVISKNEQVDKETGAIRTDVGYEIIGKLDDYLGKVSVGGDDGDDNGGGNQTEDKPPIPSGFYEVGGSIKEGFVISDEQGDDLNNTKQGNQFVWVPVPDISKFERMAGYYNKKRQSMNSYTEPYTNGYKGENTDYTNMYNSVRDNHGFYIGRFEAGKDENGNVIVKKGANVYNDVPWGNAVNDIEGTNKTGGKIGAVKLAKEFKNGKVYENSITSTLVYGVQWDATMLFMDENYNNGIYDANSYVKESSNKGWWSYNFGKTDEGNTTTNPNRQTGMDLIYSDNPNIIANQQKNIYDMAGNMEEWTMECYNTSGRVVRGGAFFMSGQYVTSSRSSYVPSYVNGGTGFRLALYL